MHSQKQERAATRLGCGCKLPKHHAVNLQVSKGERCKDCQTVDSVQHKPVLVQNCIQKFCQRNSCGLLAYTALMKQDRYMLQDIANTLSIADLQLPKPATAQPMAVSGIMEC